MFDTSVSEELGHGKCLYLKVERFMHAAQHIAAPRTFSDLSSGKLLPNCTILISDENARGHTCDFLAVSRVVRSFASKKKKKLVAVHRVKIVKKKDTRRSEKELEKKYSIVSL